MRETDGMEQRMGESSEMMSELAKEFLYFTRSPCLAMSRRRARSHAVATTTSGASPAFNNAAELAGVVAAAPLVLSLAADGEFAVSFFLMVFLTAISFVGGTAFFLATSRQSLPSPELAIPNRRGSPSRIFSQAELVEMLKSEALLTKSRIESASAQQQRQREGRAVRTRRSGDAAGDVMQARKRKRDSPQLAVPRNSRAFAQ